MCSENPTNLLYPVRIQHLDSLNEFYPKLPDNFAEDFIKIATRGINTELCVANALLSIVNNLFEGKTEETDWREGSSGILFSVLSKDFTKKYQTHNMEILHETVIPWLATINARDYEKLLEKHGIHRVFMHSCGEIAFFEEDWNEKKERKMLREQFARTRLDYTVGTEKNKLNEEILQNTNYSAESLEMIDKIIDRSLIMHHRDSMIAQFEKFLYE